MTGPEAEAEPTPEEVLVALVDLWVTGRTIAWMLANPEEAAAWAHRVRERTRAIMDALGELPR